MPPPCEPARRPSGFDFTLHMRRLCEDMASRLPALRYIDVDRVCVAFAQVRSAERRGAFASLTPMRFSGGQEYTVRRGRRYAMQRVLGPAGREMLYILRFYVPRFLDLPFREKLTTVVHELWHIGPAFDGDLRRHGGRCYAHGRSQRAYDAHAERLAGQWLALSPPAGLYDFLRLSFAELRGRYGRVYGVKVPRPKLVPAEA